VMSGRTLSRTRLMTVLACLGIAAIAGPARAATGNPVGHMARTCAVPEYPGSGYFTSLHVRAVACKSGRRLALAYYHCRTRSGPAGRCHHRVLGYRCRERRVAISTEIDARVRCRRGARRVVHTYQQDL
jgi:hypothetical protein